MGGQWSQPSLGTRMWRGRQPPKPAWCSWRGETRPTSNWRGETWWVAGSITPPPPSWFFPNRETVSRRERRTEGNTEWKSDTVGKRCDWERDRISRLREAIIDERWSETERRNEHWQLWVCELSHTVSSLYVTCPVGWRTERLFLFRYQSWWWAVSAINVYLFHFQF